MSLNQIDSLWILCKKKKSIIRTLTGNVNKCSIPKRQMSYLWNIIDSVVSKIIRERKYE